MCSAYKLIFETEAQGNAEMTSPSDAAIHWPAYCVVSVAQIVTLHTQHIISQITKPLEKSQCT